MISIYNYEGKTTEECRLNCLEALDVYDNEIIYKKYEENDIFKIEAVKKEDVKQFIIEYLENITKLMEIDSKIEIDEEDSIFTVRMYSNKNAVLIGKDGKNLASIQNLLRQTINKKLKFNIKVNIDASNYKRKKDRFFERDIKKIVNEVMVSKTETKLDSMNSYQRRIVHKVASDYYNIETESFGEEPNRHVVIRYVEK